ncbi:MAG TPA: hypothetical protein VGV15_10880 [Terriglobales bacterium]|nr:hypothetical protein [Terriglobales bacterium]
MGYLRYFALIASVMMPLGYSEAQVAIIAHFLNDATALPWATFFMITAH